MCGIGKTRPVFPLEPATRIALSTVAKWIEAHDFDMLIRSCCYSPREYEVYRKVAYELRIRYTPGSFDLE